MPALPLLLSSPQELGPAQGFSLFRVFPALFSDRWNTWRAPVGLQFSAAELRLFSAAVSAGIR